MFNPKAKVNTIFRSSFEAVIVQRCVQCALLRLFWTDCFTSLTDTFLWCDSCWAFVISTSIQTHRASLESHISDFMVVLHEPSTTMDSKSSDDYLIMII